MDDIIDFHGTGHSTSANPPDNGLIITVTNNQPLNNQHAEDILTRDTTIDNGAASIPNMHNKRTYVPRDFEDALPIISIDEMGHGREGDHEPTTADAIDDIMLEHTTTKGKKCGSHTCSL